MSASEARDIYSYPQTAAEQHKLGGKFPPAEGAVSLCL